MAGSVMLTVRASDADSLVARLFRKSGALPSHANVVARHLVESSQLGVHSHGLIRVPQYVHEIRSGHLDPRAKPRRLGRHGAVSWVSGNSGFGQVGAIYSALAATASARRYAVGLAILVEAMSTLLAGDETDDRSRVGANLAILAIATGGGFEQAAEGMARYLRSARPADPQRPVLVPGDPERLAREHSLVAVDSRAWNEIGSLARELHVEVPVPVDE